MDEQTIKKIIIRVVVILSCACALFSTGIGLGYRIATSTTDGRTSKTIENLKSDVSTLKSEKERLTDERDKLVSELTISNGKLKSITSELERCSEDYAKQSANYSKRIEESDLNVLEYNRIYVEEVLGLCDTMERTINTIAATCGYNNAKIK